MIRGLVLLIALAGCLFAAACYGDIEPVGIYTDTPSPTPRWCPQQPVPSMVYQVEEPKAGAFYTRHVPIHAWVRPENDGFVDVEVRSSSGGLFAASQVEISDTQENGLFEIDSTIVLQLLPARERACVTLSGHGWTALIPILVGGGNP